jgi:HPt (histidine-containing phosphotransfer) domain-containing protein
MPAESAVDPSVLEALVQRFGARGPAFRTTLIQTWREEAATRVGTIAQAAAAGDVEGVAGVAHALKSSSSALGAQLLATYCDELEAALRAGEARDLVAAAQVVAASVRDADREFDRLWPSDLPKGQFSAGSGG